MRLSLQHVYSKYITYRVLQCYLYLQCSLHMFCYTGQVAFIGYLLKSIADCLLIFAVGLAGHKEVVRRYNLVVRSILSA